MILFKFLFKIVFYVIQLDINIKLHLCIKLSWLYILVCLYVIY